MIDMYNKHSHSSCQGAVAAGLGLFIGLLAVAVAIISIALLLVKTEEAVDIAMGVDITIVIAINVGIDIADGVAISHGGSSCWCWVSLGTPIINNYGIIYNCYIYLLLHHQLFKMAIIYNAVLNNSVMPIIHNQKLLKMIFLNALHVDATSHSFAKHHIRNLK